MVDVFGFRIPLTMVYVLTGALALSLLLLRVRTILLVTLIVLTLPALDTPLNAISRFLRWGCLAGLIGKGMLGSLQVGLRARASTTEHTVIFIFCALFPISALWSIGAVVTLAQGAMMISLLVGVFLVMWNSWVDEEDILALCNTLFIVAALMFTLEMVYQLEGLGRTYGAGRYAGVFLNPNGMGTAVAFLGPFVFWKHHSSTNPLTRTYCKTIGVMMAIGLISSGSRSGFLGTVMCLGFIACYVYRVKLVVLGFFMTIPLVLLYVVSQQLDEPTTASLMQNRLLRLDTLPNLSDRLPMWEEGFELVKVKPIIGYGYGMSKFANIGRADFEMTKAVFRLRGANYHNAHLQLALDLGVVGLVLFWFFLFSVLRRGFNIYRSTARDPLHVAGIVFFAAFFAMTGDSIVHAWAFSPGSSMAIVFFLMAAATIRVHVLIAEQAAEEGYLEEEEEEETVPPPSPERDLVRLRDS